MPVTPKITLTFTLLDYQGNQLGSSTDPAFLRIALCGFGATLPCIPGTGNIGQVTSWSLDIPYNGIPGSVDLWGNDVIVPLNLTYYAISILDTNKNVVQTGNYQFTGTETIDLSNASQIVPPALTQALNLVQKAMTGATPGTVFACPTAVWNKQIMMVFCRGVLQRSGVDYNVTGPNSVTMTYSVSEEVPYAVYIQAVG